MADARRFADLRYGQVGQLAYIPRDDRISGEPGTLLTSRLTSHLPHFQQIGSSAVLYPASKKKLPQLTYSHIWAERNLQKRWLLKSHPEALMGNSELSGLLTEDIDRFKNLDEAANTQPLLSIGEMMDLSLPSRSSVTSVLAAATGESGELLRLARIENSRWVWDDDKDCILHLSVIDPMDQDDELIWRSDGLPISQIKFAKSVSRSESIRWLLVQKQTSTSILHPEYHKIPQTESWSYEKTQQKLSRISPNATVTLGHRETGGNAHSDVAFNAPADDWAPQICVVDECGYWTLWNVLASSRTDKKRMRLSLYRCGHIWEGALNSIPTTPMYPAEKHGVLFVGGQRTGDFWDDAYPGGLGRPGGMALRSSHILLWNSERFEIVDFETNSFLPRILEFSSTKAKFGRILDIQLSPVNQNHIFVLTARFIVWVDIFHPSKDPKTESKSRILLTCPHGPASRDGLRMTTNRSIETEGACAMVSVYSSNDSQVSIHWFGLSPDSEIPQWHSQMASLSRDQKTKGEPFTIQELVIQPLKLTCPSRSSGVGSRYRREGVQFYQGMMLGQGLGIRYCMFFASEDPRLEVTLPVNRVAWTKTNQNRRWRKKRLQILRHMGETVVVPDSMTDEAMKFLSSRRRDKDTEALELTVNPAPQNPPRPIHLNVDVLARAIGELVRGTTGQLRIGLPTELFGAIQKALQHGQSTGRLPLMTWHEIASETWLNDESKFIPAEDIEELMQDLGGDDGQTVVTQLARRRSEEPERPLGSLLQLHSQLSSIWLSPLKGRLSESDLQLRETWVSELARDLFLSLHGIAVQDTPLFGPGAPEPALDSQLSMLSPFPIPSSQPTFSTLPSSPSNTSSAAGPDEAFQRLQLLAPTIQPGTLGDMKQAKILSHWPTERGVDTKDYISSVAIVSDKKFDLARQRLQRIEAKRKAMAEKYKRPPFMRQGLAESQGEEDTMTGTRIGYPAATQIMSSQLVPASSQSQGPPGMTMSQPVAGPFGGDRKKKKGKRKSGFR